MHDAGPLTAGACQATITQGVTARLTRARSFRNQDSCAAPRVDCASTRTGPTLDEDAPSLNDGLWCGHAALEHAADVAPF